MSKFTDILFELQQKLELELDAKKKNHFIQQQNKIMKQLLRRLAFQIFLLVADADGKIDPKEVAQFRKLITQRERYCVNKYTRRIYHETVVNYSTLLGHYHTGRIKKNFNQVIKTMAYVQMCVTPETMAEFCNDLDELAVAVAEASGGLIGLKSSISQEEQKVIDKLRAIYKESVQEAKGRDPKTRNLFNFLNF